MYVLLEIIIIETATKTDNETRTTLKAFESQLYTQSMKRWDLSKNITRFELPFRTAYDKREGKKKKHKHKHKLLRGVMTY